jgi:hypothetical protein
MLFVPKIDLFMDNPTNKLVSSPKLKLLDKVRAAIFMKHYPIRTEVAYWIHGTVISKELWQKQKQWIPMNKIITIRVAYNEIHW